MRTLDGPAANMADVLKEWREEKGISKYAIAKYENIRIEVVTACEEGRASMGGLCMYLDFIAEKDREFFENFTKTWWKRNGYV